MRYCKGERSSVNNIIMEGVNLENVFDLLSSDVPSRLAINSTHVKLAHVAV